MAPVVEPLEQAHQRARGAGVVGRQGGEHLELHHRGVAVLVNVADDLDRYVPRPPAVPALDHAPEGALAELAHDLDCGGAGGVAVAAGAQGLVEKHGNQGVEPGAGGQGRAEQGRAGSAGRGSASARRGQALRGAALTSRREVVSHGEHVVPLLGVLHHGPALAVADVQVRGGEGGGHAGAGHSAALGRGRGAAAATGRARGHGVGRAGGVGRGSRQLGGGQAGGVRAAAGLLGARAAQARRRRGIGGAALALGGAGGLSGEGRLGLHGVALVAQQFVVSHRQACRRQGAARVTSLGTARGRRSRPRAAACAGREKPCKFVRPNAARPYPRSLRCDSGIRFFVTNHLRNKTNRLTSAQLIRGA